MYVHGCGSPVEQQDLSEMWLNKTQSVLRPAGGADKIQSGEELYTQCCGATAQQVLILHPSQVP